MITNERITIRSIAKIFNVSPKTVSRALNDKSGVSEELRTKIKEVAAEKNYIPSLFGKGLKGETTKTIGVIISDNANPNNSQVIKGIENVAAKFDYNIILCNSNESGSLESKQIKMLVQKHVDGIILAPATFENSTSKGIRLLKDLNTPIVLLNRTRKNEECDFVKTDNVLSGYLATQNLIEKGHKKIINISIANKVSSAFERIEGYKKALQEYGMKMCEANIYFCKSVSIDDGYDIMTNVLMNRRDLTAVVAYNDLIAFGVMKAILEKGLKVPEDISVIGYDDIEFAQISSVPLTTIHQENHLIGSIAMKILLRKLDNINAEKSQILIKPYVVERNSVILKQERE